MKRNILLTPGPVTTSERVKQAMLRPDVCPRDEDMQKTIAFIRESLIKIVGGDDNYTAIPLCGSGTLAMEAAMISAYQRIYTRRPNKILIIVNGAYGKRFFKMGVRHSIPTFSEEFGWGKKIDLKKLEETLMGGGFSHVFVTHHETSTGILNQINEIGNVVKKHDCIYVVDAVSSIGGVPFSIRESKADWVIGSANKCLQGMPGVSFVICKKTEIEKPHSPKSLYLDVSEYYDSLEKTGQLPFTAPAQVLWAFEEALKELFEEGLSERFKRYKRLHIRLLDGMRSRGFIPYLGNDVTRSCLIETFYEPRGFDFKRFHDKLSEKGIVIYPGKLTHEKTFRLGNTGDLTETDIDYFLVQLDVILSENLRKRP